MMYVFFSGRIGKDAEVVTGSFGTFMSVNLAVQDFEKGENVTSWVKVRSQLEQHIKLSKYLKKGTDILIEGILKKPYTWTDKEGNLHVRQCVTATSIQFLAKRKKVNEESPEPGEDDDKHAKSQKAEAALPSVNDENDLPF